MADSPLTVDSVQTEVTTLNLSTYAHGMQDFYVFGYVTFGDGTYWESPQFINFVKQRFYPQNKRFSQIKAIVKPGVSLRVRPIYGNLDALNPTVQGEIINLAVGAVAGLATPLADGLMGAAPVLLAL